MYKKILFIQEKAHKKIFLKIRAAVLKTKSETNLAPFNTIYFFALKPSFSMIARYLSISFSFR